MMRRVLILAAVAVALAAPAHAQKTKAELTTDVSTTFPDNTSGLITPSGVRTFQNDFINSIMPTAPVVSGNLACFSGTTGLLQDCGSAPTANAITALTGDITATGPGSVAATLATVNAGVGSFGSSTATPVLTVNAKGLVTAASSATITPAVTDLTGMGANVPTALGVNVGTAGSIVVNGGVLGTPSSGTGTNITGLSASNVSTGTLSNARLAWNGAVLTANPGSPGSTTSTIQVMAGVGGTCTITPVSSTRLYIRITGNASNSNAGIGTLMQARYGTGAAPANGAAATGTTLGAQLSGVSHAANNVFPFTIGGIATGLSPGTAYWIDVGFGAGTNTSSLTNLTCVAYEL